MSRLKPGDTVVFDHTRLNQDYWASLPEKERVAYWGRFGYGGGELKLFTYITEHHPQDGHCVLMDMDTGQLLPMCHPDEFRLATDEEC